MDEGNARMNQKFNFKLVIVASTGSHLSCDLKYEVGGGHTENSLREKI